MTKPAGGFIWYELMTTDPFAAKAFYEPVVGWSMSIGHANDEGYGFIARSDGGMAGGLLRLSQAMVEHGARPAWIGYLHVVDIDAAVGEIEAAGGKLLMPARDVEMAGRIAMIADPQGAPIYLMTPTPPVGQPDAESGVFSVDQPQHVRWNELQSSDPDGSIAFYTGQFGWTQQGEMDMGSMGKYRFVQHDGITLGAIMPKMPAVPHSVWSFYIGVDDIDRAAAAVTAGGGTLNGAINEIPGGEFSLHCSDPQGAAFGLVGPRKA